MGAVLGALLPLVVTWARVLLPPGVTSSVQSKRQCRTDWFLLYAVPLLLFAGMVTIKRASPGSIPLPVTSRLPRLALAQMPGHLRRRVLIRADSGGGTHEFLTWLTRPGQRLHGSAGFTITEDIQQAILKLNQRVESAPCDSVLPIRFLDPPKTPDRDCDE
jgi:hypothetical protein